MPYILPQPVREQTAPYVVFEKLFSNEECEKIIALRDVIKPEVAKVGNGDDGVVAPDKRRTEVRWIEYATNHQWLFEKMANSIVAANNKWWGFHLSGLNEALQLTHYKSEDLGHYDWHEDHGDSGNFLHRKLSVVTLLNDSFEGGQFEFWHIGQPSEFSKGTMIIFPSYKLHRVKPVTDGERWSLVSWVNGPPFA
jgi:PKHD-type hydroxylase